MLKKFEIYLLILFLTIVLGCPSPSSGSDNSKKNEDTINQNESLDDNTGRENDNHTTYEVKLNILNLKSELGVEISWDSVIGIHEYKISKYSHSSEESLIGEILHKDAEPDKVQLIKLIDSSFEESDKLKSFYYRITCIKNTEAVFTSDLVSIVYKEFSEDRGNDKATAKEFANNLSSSLFNSKDVDWYNLGCLTEDFILEVENLDSKNINKSDVEVFIHYGEVKKKFPVDLSGNNKIFSIESTVITDNRLLLGNNVYLSISFSESVKSSEVFLKYRISNFQKSGPRISSFNVSKMSTKNSLELTWTSLRGVKEYRVFKYSYAKEDSLIEVLNYIDNDPGKIKVISVTDSNFSINDKNIPQFYKVAYLTYVGNLNTTVLSNKSNFEYGVFTESIDPYEPKNNSIPNKEVGSDIFDSGNPNIYSLPDGNGGVVSDIDWYKLKDHNPVSFDLKVIVLKSSNINNGDVVLQFYHNGEFLGNPYPIKSSGNTWCSFDYPGGTSKVPIDIYYRIIFKNTDIKNTKYMEYTISK